MTGDKHKLDNQSPDVQSHQDLIDALTQLLTTQYSTKKSVVEKLTIIKENKKEIEKLTKKVKEEI